MSKNKNRFGLSRYIPEDIKRLVRQNSKFGCVVPGCRISFYEYEHILPEFKDARAHDPEKIGSSLKSGATRTFCFWNEVRR